MRVKKRRAVLISLDLSKNYSNEERLIGELELLLSNLDVEVVSTVVQKRKAPDPAFFVGYGKAISLKDTCQGLSADLLVSNIILSPKQRANLQAVSSCEVWDRSFVIMKIFELRARTSEAKLQVELARCRYELPHLKGLGHQMSRLGGGIGTRGPGETEFERHRRKLERRIRDINKKLKQVQSRRDSQRKRRTRSGILTVSLVGYTNSGKSTLLKALSGDSNIYSSNRLFATLDTLIRTVRLPSGRSVLFSDTVGFIRDLPPSLIAAFRTTLEEAVFSDYLLVVTDCTDPDYRETLDVVRATLLDIGAGHIPRALILNKSDLIDPLQLEKLSSRLEKEENDVLSLSALTGEGLEGLYRLIEKRSVDH